VTGKKRAVDNDNLDKAKEIAEEGIRQDQKDRPGLADNRVDWLDKAPAKGADGRVGKSLKLSILP
jgi:hypothetical protein